ncbi:glucosyl-3-phosphoglycerate synthase [Labedaea rhizosphaerae]|uniref:Glucosyl-3-phosphoglycerate synthase n=1 Tax=Labedaea rhizosphaerae TaxID=598644 RepID=A0A4R6S2F4_LABRH|nr:glucosyl-3-phosphoglycerate synthase [Labedaea rhizosphaerae]TDP93799.1 glucosyl-3-phosphoglycerate synthase [Labedaea rhizosphaerae]
MHSWFTENTYQSPSWTEEELLQAKGSRTVSVVLPALDEEPTVAGVIESVRPLVGSLVDELVVVDSGSTDRTAAVASAAGARVVHRTDVLPELEPLPGKGEVLWRSLAATSGDLLVFLDSDLVSPAPWFVPRLLGPLFFDDDVHLVKSFYRRPLGASDDAGGGRVTELVARPLLAALRPELAMVVQPLSGEYAARRSFLESVPFAAGYGVEIGLLLDAHSRYGLAGLAQVNLGVRRHRNRPLAQLGVMARQVLGTALARAGVAGSAAGLTQFVEVMGEWLPDPQEVLLADRPPINEVAWPPVR